jgi:UDP-glucose 4-epimerase
MMVTGASGFIGRNTLLRMPREWEAVAVFHRSTDFESFLAAHRLSNVRAEQCDLRDDSAVTRLADRVGRVDACLYLAANGDPAVSAERPRADLESNTVALLNVLEHCPPRHLVYLSSGAVYDGLVGPVSPDSALALAPTLPYAISKLASERYIRFYANGRRSLDSFINVRFFGAFGPYEPARKITTRWLLALASGQREFVLRGDGRNLIDFMYVDDAVDGFLVLTKALGTTATVDFASGAPVTVNEVVEAMARTLGVEVTVRHQGRTEEYIQFRSTDHAMRERFGIAPSISFDEGLRRLSRFFQEEQREAGHFR